MNNMLCEACGGMGQIVDSVNVDGGTIDCPICDGKGFYTDLYDIDNLEGITV